jgi:hypothetical protein
LVISGDTDLPMTICNIVNTSNQLWIIKEPYKLTFGQDGKPLYVSGPYDDVEKIVKQLEATAGHGNFDVVINIG